MTALLVAVGAAVGSPLRYLAGRWLDQRRHWGTLVVNLLGSFVLGALVGGAVDGNAFALFGTGLCGGLTTYSAFAVQTGQVGQSSRARAATYVVVTVGGCLATATLGHWLATALP